MSDPSPQTDCSSRSASSTLVTSGTRLSAARALPLTALPFPLRQLKPLFIIKAVTIPVCAVAMMGWASTSFRRDHPAQRTSLTLPFKVHEAGDQASEVLRASPTLKGRDSWYAFMTAVSACMGTWTTLVRSSCPPACSLSIVSGSLTLGLVKT